MADKSPPDSSPGLTGGHEDGRLVAPSASRNVAPITESLGPVLGSLSGMMLEIGSGTGQHATAWAEAFPDLDWQPSDPFDEHLDSIRAWIAHAALPNLRAPIWLDAAEDWPSFGPLAGVISVNVIHITPWVVTKGIFRGAQRAGAKVLIFYGPFKEGGQHTGEGNARFDESLRAQDAAWGVRDLDDLAELARRHDFGAPEIIGMPANNRLLVFRRS